MLVTRVRECSVCLPYTWKRPAAAPHLSANGLSPAASSEGWVHPHPHVPRIGNVNRVPSARVSSGPLGFGNGGVPPHQDVLVEENVYGTWADKSLIIFYYDNKIECFIISEFNNK